MGCLSLIRLNRSFFQAWEKRLLLVNCYAIWLSYWCIYNDGFGSNEVFSKLIVVFHVPKFFCRSLTSLLGYLVCRDPDHVWTTDRSRRPCTRAGGTLVFHGALRLAFSLLDPWSLLIVPAFHSLQYLVVVWRFKLSELAARRGSQMRAFSGFLLFGFLVGIAVFIIVPLFLDTFIDYGRTALGSGIFLFFFVVFINIHHYFLDNVMWRRENPDVRRYLMTTS